MATSNMDEDMMDGVVEEEEIISDGGDKNMDMDEADGELNDEPPYGSEQCPLQPSFPPLTSVEMAGTINEVRKVPVPPHRMTPLKVHWMELIDPVVNQLKLQIRMNTHTKQVEIKTSPQTEDIGSIQKGADFVRAFMLGFEIKDAIALIRLDDLYLDSFEVTDVKTLHGDHLSRAIGRIAGKDGKTKFAIENATRTRIVVADKQIHILGSFANIKLARDAIVSLILGSPPGKVYAKMRTVAGRLNQRF